MRLPQPCAAACVCAVTVRPPYLVHECGLTPTACAIPQLRQYPTTLEQDNALLAEGQLAPFSNRRNALLVVRGEKEVYQQWTSVAATASELLLQPLEQVAALVREQHCGSDATAVYIRAAVLPVLRRALAQAADAAPALLHDVCFEAQSGSALHGTVVVSSPSLGQQEYPAAHAASELDVGHVAEAEGGCRLSGTTCTRV